MSDRIADECSHVIDRLDRIDPQTGWQRRRLQEARQILTAVADDDRERNGPTSTDLLLKEIEESDGCINCGKPVDDAAWCSAECLNETKDDNSN